MYDDNHLLNGLARGYAQNPEAVFLIHRSTGEKTRYFEFFENAERLAFGLRDLGLKSGDRVAVQAPKTQIMLELYLATVMAGGVFLPLNTAYTPSEIQYFLDDAAPKIFVCAKEQEVALRSVASKIDHVLSIAPDESGSVRDLREAYEAGFAPLARGPEDLAAILYTSGTTGRSKGAMLSHRALLSNAQSLVKAWRFTAKDRLIHALPIFHTHGLFVATNISLIAGGQVDFLTGFDSETIVDLMPEATSLMGVPTFYTRLLQSPKLAQNAKNMRLFVSGSAPLLAETHNLWRQITGHAILERYGMTETNMNTSNPYEGERRAGTVGFPLEGVELKITDPVTGAELEREDIGMIEVRGENLFSGYWNMPEKTKEEMRESGFFITGDLGKIDADGYVHIVGRGKDLIISGGYNIYPKEIELVIDAVPGVVETAVIGVPHADFGEAVVAVVVADETAVNEADIMALVRENLARFKHPQRIEFVTELPRNTMGKVQKAALRERYGKAL